METLLGAHLPMISGGALIGVALALLLILTGRTMSVAGMIGNLRGGSEGLAATSITFLAGLLLAPSIARVFGTITSPPPETSWLFLAVGGVLLGFGARLGQCSVLGCIAGLMRGSGRSIFAMLAIVAGVAVSPLVIQALSAGGVT